MPDNGGAAGQWPKGVSVPTSSHRVRSGEVRRTAWPGGGLAHRGAVHRQPAGGASRTPPPGSTGVTGPPEGRREFHAQLPFNEPDEGAARTPRHRSTTLADTTQSAVSVPAAAAPQATPLTFATELRYPVRLHPIVRCRGEVPGPHGGCGTPPLGDARADGGTGRAQARYSGDCRRTCREGLARLPTCSPHCRRWSLQRRRHRSDWLHLQSRWPGIGLPRGR